MKFNNPAASFFIPDSISVEESLARTTHLGIGAHPDDLEIMAFHGINRCYDHPQNWFGGITCTHGSGSARSGQYSSFSDAEMIQIRKKEQEKAAALGKYGFVLQLHYASSSIRESHLALSNDILKVLEICRPSVIYTHNPADKHDTHIAVFIAVIHAIRRLPKEKRPVHVYGCEVWRGLDWLSDNEKVALDVSDPHRLGKALIDVFQSQIAGGKRYDLAVPSRWRANATYFQSHQIDHAQQLAFAMDLAPLVNDDSLDIIQYVISYIKRFQQDVETKLQRYTRKIN